MTPWLDDGDVRLYHGDNIDVLRQLPDRSVHMCATSPPFYGLRDYGTGAWEGGDPDCSHRPKRGAFANGCSGCGGPMSGQTEGCKQCAHRHLMRRREGVPADKDYQPFDPNRTRSAQRDSTPAAIPAYRDVCGKCGARRVDQQIGLEDTPDQWVERLVAVFREVRRVLRDDGTLWVEIGDSYSAGGLGPGGSAVQAGNVGANLPHAKKAPPGYKQKDLLGQPWLLAFALRADGWYLRSEIIWARPNPMPESVTDRPTKSHSTVFLLSKQPRYFYDADAIREPASPNTHARYSGKKVERGVVTPKGRIGHEGWDSATNGYVSHANARSVWQIPTQPTPFAHFATWPEALVRRMILAGSPEGGVVLDPFAGSATTMLVARNHGRHSIGIELNADYLQIAARRLQQLSLLTC